MSQMFSLKQTLQKITSLFRYNNTLLLGRWNTQIEIMKKYEGKDYPY